MVYIPYHSGSASPEQEKALADGALPVVEARLAPSSGPAFRITFRTAAFRPSHRVTLRNAVDGWERDVYGVYRDGEWVFELPRERYPAVLPAKLLLDGEHWMQGPDLQLPTDRDHHLDAASVSFAAADDRLLLGYDNLRVEEGIGQQERMRANHRPEPHLRRGGHRLRLRWRSARRRPVRPGPQRAGAGGGQPHLPLAHHEPAR